MNFETDYKNIHFQINVEKEIVNDLSQLMGDKFNRLPNQTMIEIKKGNLASYNVIIVSKYNGEELTHYLPSVILTSKEVELMEEIGNYLDQENVLDDIEKCWKRNQVSPGPLWRV
jgi:hypothetical protein